MRPQRGPRKAARGFVGKGEARKQVELSPQAEARPADFASTLERVMGIEPTRPAWKAGILPLNYTRKFNALLLYHKFYGLSSVF